MVRRAGGLADEQAEGWPRAGESKLRDPLWAPARGPRRQREAIGLGGEGACELAAGRVRDEVCTKARRRTCAEGPAVGAGAVAAAAGGAIGVQGDGRAATA